MPEIVNTQDISIIDTGGTINIDIDVTTLNYTIVPVSNPLTMNGSVTIAPDPMQTPVKGMIVNFLFDSSIILANGLALYGFDIFGYAATQFQMLTAFTVQCYYNGSAWEVYFNQSSDNSTPYIYGADIIDGSVPLVKLEAIAAGNLVMGNAGTVPTSTAVTGDIAITDAGVTTIQPAVVTLAKMDDLTSANFILGNGSNRPAAVQMTGNVTMDNAGVTTIGAGQVTPSMLSFSPTIIQSASVTLSSAQILALNGTPIQIVASPGGGSSIKGAWLEVEQTFVTTPYATNIDLQVYTETASIAQFSCSCLNFSVSRIFILALLVNISPGASDTQIIQNKGIFVTVSGGNPTGGDGTVQLTLYYTTD